MSKADEYVFLERLGGQSCQKQDFASNLKTKVSELYIMYAVMLVYSHIKYFNLENVLKIKDVQCKA